MARSEPCVLPLRLDLALVRRGGDVRQSGCKGELGQSSTATRRRRTRMTEEKDTCLLWRGPTGRVCRWHTSSSQFSPFTWPAHTFHRCHCHIPPIRSCISSLTTRSRPAPRAYRPHRPNRPLSPPLRSRPLGTWKEISDEMLMRGSGLVPLKECTGFSFTPTGCMLHPVPKELPYKKIEEDAYGNGAYVAAHYGMTSV